MGKTGKTTLGIFVGLISITLFFWLLRAALVSSYLTNQVGIPISIEDLSLSSQRLELEQLKVPNPRGFPSEDAYQSQKTIVSYRWKNLFKNPYEIDSIVMQGVVINVDFSGKLSSKNNWMQLAHQTRSRVSAKPSIIHKLVLQDVRVNIRSKGLIGPNQSYTIGRIELDEIDSRKGFPTKELIAKVFSKAGLEQYIEDLLNPTKIIEKIPNPFKLFGLQIEEE